MNYFRQLLTIGVVLIATTTISFALKAEYRFEKCDGTATLENHAGSGLDGALSGDANISLGDGKIENALILSGNGMMSVEHSSQLDLVKDLTISFWIKPSEIKKQALVTRGLGVGTYRRYASNAEYFIKMLDGGQLTYRHSFVESSGAVVAYSDSNISANVWTHVVFTRDDSSKSMRFYINGVANTQYSYTTEPISSNSEKLIFGFCDGCVEPSRFSGKLDEIKIYNIALTEDEVATLYNNENEGEYSTGECHLPPLVVDDNADLPYAGEVTVDILANDRANDSSTCAVDASSVVIHSIPVDSNLSDDNKTLTVKDEGEWSVQENGSILFISESSFLGNPTDINYTVADSCGNLGNNAIISLTRVAPVPVSTPRPVSTPVPAPVSTPTPISTPVPTPTPTAVPTSTPVPTTIPTSTPTPIPTVTPTPLPTPVVTPMPVFTPIETILPVIIEPSIIVENNATMGDLVWYDINRNGIQDNSEQGVKNITVVLFDKNGSVVDRTLTDSNGIYQLEAPKGTYTIGFSNLPAHYSFTSQNMGSNDTKDSDVDSSGRTKEFTIDSNMSSLTYDAGIVSPIDINITIHPSIDDNSSVIAEDCECDDYESSVPSMNVVGLVVIWLLVSLLGVLFLRGDEFDFNKK